MFESEEREAPQNSPDGTNLSKSDEYLFAKQINKNIRAAKDHLKKWQDQARESYDFFAGNQWDESDLAILREQERPAIVFNRIPRVINAVAGIEIQNRQEVAYLPRTNDDVGVSDLLTHVADYVRDNCDAEDEESQAFKDCLMTGMGWTETHLDYEIEEDGVILIDRIDPLEMYYDPASSKRNLDDAAWVARIKHYDRKDFEEMWPEAIDEVNLDFTDDPKGMQPHDATLAPWYINDQSDKNEENDKNVVEVVQYQWWEREPYYRVEFLDGNIKNYSVDEFRENRKEMMDFVKFYNRQHRKTYKQAFLAGNFVLERGDCPVNAFTFRAITGFTDYTSGIWFGLIQIMKDPQRWANKWLSQALHILNSNAKGGYFAETDAFEDPREAEQSIAKPSITYVNEDKLDKIREKVSPGLPPGIERLLEYAVSSVSDLVGVNLEMLGMANREQSGVVEAQRKRAGITVVSDFFDSLKRYRKEAGRVLADYIIKYISDGRLIKISGESSQRFVPLLKDKVNFPYDIVVDESPSSPNQRELVFDRLITLFPYLIQANVPIPKEILDYSPLPEKLIQQWKQQIEAAEQPNPMAQQIEELRMRLAQAETMLKEFELAKKQAETIETQTKSALNIAKASHENALADTEGQEAVRENIKAVESLVSER